MGDPLRFVELASLAVLGLFVLMGVRTRQLRGQALDMVWVALAAWVAEASCIEWYGFYQYDAPWVLFVGPMPLLVAIIWPFVVFSARSLAQAFGTRPGLGTAVTVLAIVFYDASLVEPVAVASKIWSWNEATLFSVPLIGIVGWALFASMASYLLDRLPRERRWLLIFIAPSVTHLGLLASWWGCLRWILRAPLSNTVAIGLSVFIALGLSILVRRKGLSAPLDVMLPRVGAALLFFALAISAGFDDRALVLFALPFSVPYLLATRLALAPRGKSQRDMLSSCAPDAR